MGEMVEFASNGGKASGYLATPANGQGPGILVIQEYWGLVDHIKDVADRFAAEGFVALAPDMYHGATATEPDEAGKLMMSMNLEQAAKDLSGAVTLLQERSGQKEIGVVGFCMGGMLSWLLACNRPDKVQAVVSFYGFPQGEMEPDWSQLDAPVRGHMAENDDFFGPEGARSLESKLQGMGKDVQLTVHEGTGHAFMGPHNALGTLNEKLAEKIWPEVTAFLKTKVV